MSEEITVLAGIYGEHANLRLSTIAKYAVNGGNLFVRLEAGSTCTLRTAEKMKRWLSDVWPADLEWPSNISRPPHGQSDTSTHPKRKRSA